MTLASFFSCAGRFESYLVKNPEDRFLVMRLIYILWTFDSENRKSKWNLFRSAVQYGCMFKKFAIKAYLCNAPQPLDFICTGIEQETDHSRKCYTTVQRWSCHTGNCNDLSHVMRKSVMPYANNKGADQPAHPCSLISAFVVRCLDSILSLVSIFAMSWLLSKLCLILVHML